MIRLFCGVLVLLLLATSTQAQNTHKDSCSILEKNFSSAIAKHAFQEAQVTLNQLRSLSKTLHGDASYIYLSTYLKQGQIEILKGNWNLAIALFLKTKRLLTKYQPQKKAVIISVYNGLGNLYTFKNILDSALHYHSIALEQRIALFGTNSLKIATSYNNLAALYLRKKKYQLTINYFRKEVTIYLTNPSSKPEDIARTYNNIARTYILRHQQDSALYYYQKALIANSKGFESVSINTLPDSNQVFFNLSIAFETLFRKSELLSNPHAIIKHLKLADKLAKGIRQQLTYRAEKVRFLRRSGAFFELAISVIWQLTQQPNLSQAQLTKYQQLFFYFSERSKGNILLDQVANRNEVNIPIISLSQAQNSLMPTQALLEFVHSGKELYIQVIAKNKVSIRKLLSGITKAALYETANEFRFASHSIDLEDFIRDSPKLYKQLITPISDLIKGKKRLLIVPTSELTNFPFEVLTPNKLSFNAESPLAGLKGIKYLLHSHIVSYHVSSTLAFIHQPRSYELDYFGIGFKQFSHKRFTDLKYSEQEIKESATYFNKTKTLLGYPLAKKQAMNELNSRILHISTHGNFQNEYLMGLIFPKGGGQLDTLEVKDIYQMNITTELAILSGCDSGAGQLIPHEGVFGFTHAFLYSNTPAVIYSLWSASDAGSKNIMKLFYETLKKNGDRDYAKALTLAKRQYSKKYYLPAVWGNFVINSR